MHFIFPDDLMTILFGYDPNSFMVCIQSAMGDQYYFRYLLKLFSVDVDLLFGNHTQWKWLSEQQLVPSHSWIHNRMQHKEYVSLLYDCHFLSKQDIKVLFKNGLDMQSAECCALAQSFGLTPQDVPNMTITIYSYPRFLDLLLDWGFVLFDKSEQIQLHELFDQCQRASKKDLMIWLIQHAITMPFTRNQMQELKGQPTILKTIEYYHLNPPLKKKPKNNRVIKKRKITYDDLLSYQCRYDYSDSSED